LDSEWKGLLLAALSCTLIVVVYISVYKVCERRPITEFSARRLGPNLLSGVLLGAILQSLTILVIYLARDYTVTSVNPIISVLPALAMSASAAIVEETVFRGIIFRIAEERLGSYWALAISAFIFGGLHFANPHSSILAAVGLMIQAGLLLGAAYILTRNLWFPIGLHFAWDFTQSGIYGAVTSGGSTSGSLLTSHIQGATAITGGPFGPEGSLQATVFCLIAAVILLLFGRMQGKIVRPYWKR
jgi:membrane protease YdiL (CAAX protease family)